jgi:hypothetical protein
MTRRLSTAISLLALTACACSDSAGWQPEDDAGSRSETFASGAELRVSVADAGRRFVKLSPPSIVDLTDAPEASLDWDLAFDGFDVFTNGGVSGCGGGAAFGPLEAETFASGDTSEVPFLTPDKTGGAFHDWYAYEGETHALFSRYHVYGVTDGGRSWKVQVLGYYGQRDEAVISALYSVRYAEIESHRVGPTREHTDLDGSAGGVAASPAAPSECLDLADGTRSMLTPEAARASHGWHLCFRRASIVVNGEAGGPRGVRAVDLAADGTDTATIAAIKARTPDTERSAFEAVSAVALEGKTFRGDRAISAFSDLWADRANVPNKPRHAAWLVRDALGRQHFLVGFTSFENPTPRSPGTVVVRIKPVRG